MKEPRLDSTMKPDGFENLLDTSLVSSKSGEIKTSRLPIQRSSLVEPRPDTKPKSQCNIPMNNASPQITTCVRKEPQAMQKK